MNLVHLKESTQQNSPVTIISNRGLLKNVAWFYGRQLGTRISQWRGILILNDRFALKKKKRKKVLCSHGHMHPSVLHCNPIVDVDMWVLY